MPDLKLKTPILIGKKINTIIDVREPKRFKKVEWLQAQTYLEDLEFQLKPSEGFPADTNFSYCGGARAAQGVTLKSRFTNVVQSWRFQGLARCIKTISHLNFPKTKMFVTYYIPNLRLP